MMPKYILGLCLLMISCLYGCNATGQKPVPSGATVRTTLKTGAERTGLYLPLLKEKRVAVVANHTSLVGKTHLVDTLLAEGIAIEKIFCPEHGFRGQAEAGAAITSGRDEKTGLEVVSLYGSNKKPTPGQMQGVDVVVFDLQDVGCRFYTYISTLHYVMEACAENGCKLIVLDRPNPNGGRIDGPVLDSELVSFVGMRPGTPILYGMTIGEYALMIDQEHAPAKEGYELNIVKLQGWKHGDRYVLPVAPSPNLKTEQAIGLYPSLCWFEGANISVGRGTEYPFEVVGAPDYPYPNITFTPVAIKGVSENPPFKNITCYGLDLREAAIGDSINLKYLIRMYRNTPKEKFFLKNNFFDKLAGTRKLRQQLESNTSEKEIRASWQDGLEKFKAVRAKFLLYED